MMFFDRLKLAGMPASVQRVFEDLTKRPVQSVPKLQQRLGMTSPTVRTAIRQLAQLEIVNLLTAYQLDQYGHYGEDDPLLCDPADIREIVTSFQERLASVEAEIHRRNADREVPYHGMLPSKISNSASV